MSGFAYSADWLLQLCQSWPGVEHRVQWGGDRVFLVCGKLFAITPDINAEQISFQVPREHFVAMTDLPGVRPAPYLARAHWVTVSDPGDWAETWMRARVRDSYNGVAAKLTKKRRSDAGITSL